MKVSSTSKAAVTPRRSTLPPSRNPISSLHCALAPYSKTSCSKTTTAWTSLTPALPRTRVVPTPSTSSRMHAFGVLPPVSSLTPAQAMYHFISGYTAKVAGTEVGVKEPSATFSPCFGGPFLVWHPNKYAELLAEKMKRYGSRVWLVNTGWSGGPYGVGRRIKLANTRAIVDAIHSGALVNAKTQRDPIFGF